MKTIIFYIIMFILNFIALSMSDLDSTSFWAWLFTVIIWFLHIIQSLFDYYYIKIQEEIKSIKK